MKRFFHLLRRTGRGNKTPLFPATLPCRPWFLRYKLSLAKGWHGMPGFFWSFLISLILLYILKFNFFTDVKTGGWMKQWWEHWRRKCMAGLECERLAELRMWRVGKSITGKQLHVFSWFYNCCNHMLSCS